MFLRDRLFIKRYLQNFASWKRIATFNPFMQSIDLRQKFFSCNNCLDFTVKS